MSIHLYISISMYIYLYLYINVFIYICAAISNGKRKTEAKVTFLNPFIVCSLCRLKFVNCPFVYNENNWIIRLQSAKRTKQTCPPMHETKRILGLAHPRGLDPYRHHVELWYPLWLVQIGLTVAENDAHEGDASLQYGFCLGFLTKFRFAKISRN
jgi:hypothetical protein